MEQINRALLTILVPTWNRRAKLEVLLARLLPAVAEHQEVSVLISNNGSTDGTKEYLDSLPSLPRVSIVHQPINYGCTIHLSWLLGQTKGEYLWLHGDDDLPEEGTIPLLCRVLKAHPELAWVYLPHVWRLPSGSFRKTRIPDNDEWYADGREAFVRYSGTVGFITSMVLKSALVHSVLPMLRFETDYWPLWVTYMVSCGRPAFVPAGVHVVAGLFEEVTWKERLFEVEVLNGMPRQFAVLPGLTRAEFRACMEHWVAGFGRVRLCDLMLLRPSLFAHIAWRAPSVAAMVLDPCVWVENARRLFRTNARRRMLRHCLPHLGPWANANPDEKGDPSATNR